MPFSITSSVADRNTMGNALRDIYRISPWKYVSPQEHYDDLQDDVDIIPLNPYLHDCWDRKKFSLEVVGTSPDETDSNYTVVHLRWHWFPIYPRQGDIDPITDKEFNHGPLRWVDVNERLDPDLPCPPLLSNKPTFGSAYLLDNNNLSAQINDRTGPTDFLRRSIYGSFSKRNDRENTAGVAYVLDSPSNCTYVRRGGGLELPKARSLSP